MYIFFKCSTSDLTILTLLQMHEVELVSDEEEEEYCEFEDFTRDSDQSSGDAEEERQRISEKPFPTRVYNSAVLECYVSSSQWCTSPHQTFPIMTPAFILAISSLCAILQI